MTWGDAFTSAWNSASNAAKAAVEAVSNAVQYVVDKVYNAAVWVAETLIPAVAYVVQQAYTLVKKAFSGKKAGAPAQGCPHAGVKKAGGVKPGGKKKPEQPDTPPVVEDINIVSVEWLDGDDVKTIGDCEQFVNLPHDAKWLADSGIANIDRLSIQPRFIVKFDQPKSAGYQWRIKPVPGGTPDYTAAEEGRNANFVPSSKTWSLSSVTDGKEVKEGARLVAGGGFKFRIEARDDKGKVVQSGVITTKRLFWYVELPMKNLVGALNSTASLDGEFAKHHIVLKQLPDLEIAHQENIDTNVAADKALLKTNIGTAVEGTAAAKAKAPFLVRVAYTDHIADKNANQRQRKRNVRVGPGKPAAVLSVAAPGLMDGDGDGPRSLWNDIVTGESWWVSSTYTPNDGGAPIDIPKEKVTASGTGSDLGQLKVDVTGLPAGKGTIDIFVDVIDSMAGGLSLGGAGNICVCTRAWWHSMPQAEQAGVIVHELGHKVHMVADGSEVDKVSTHYTGRGHQGDHCYHGCPANEASYGTDASIAASKCVMFGSTNSLTAFCGNCEPAVKKVDLASGF